MDKNPVTWFWDKYYSNCYLWFNQPRNITLEKCCPLLISDPFFEMMVS